VKLPFNQQLMLSGAASPHRLTRLHLDRGNLTFRVGRDTFAASVGSYVVEPRGVPHRAFRLKAMAGSIGQVWQL
jgi:hypothetical protein